MVGQRLPSLRNGTATCLSQSSWRAPGHEDSSDMTDIELDKPSRRLNRCCKCNSKLREGNQVCLGCSAEVTRIITHERPAPDVSESEDELVSDVSESEASDDMESSDDDDNMTDEETQKENVSDSLVFRKRSKRPFHFIRVNQRPMIEMISGSNVWYQARILKERPTQLLITFPGVTEEEDDTREWLEKTSERIWYGDYKMRSWKYLGKGSWAPKANNKRKPPPVPKGVPPSQKSQLQVQEKQHQHQHRRDQSSVATTSWSDRVDDDTAEQNMDRMPQGKAHSDAEHSATHSGCRRAASMEEVQDTHPGPSQSRSDEQAVEIESPPKAADDSLQQWFLLHFSKLGGSAFISSHPAYSKAAEASAGQLSPGNRAALPAAVKHKRSNCSPTGVLSGVLSHPSDLQPVTRASGQVTTSRDDGDGDGVCISSPLNVAEPSCGTTKGCPRPDKVRVRSASEERARAEKKRNERASSHDVSAAGLQSDTEGRPAQLGDWRPPKELCGLLDGMFEVQHPRQRIQKTLPTSALHLPKQSNGSTDVAPAAPNPSDMDAAELTAAAVRDSAAVHKQSPRHKKHKELADRVPGISAPKSHKRQRSPAFSSRPRGRVLMSDSEDDSEDDTQRKPVRPTHKASKKLAEFPCHAAAKKASHAAPPGLKDRNNPRNFFTM